MRSFATQLRRLASVALVTVALASCGGGGGGGRATRPPFPSCPAPTPVAVPTPAPRSRRAASGCRWGSPTLPAAAGARAFWPRSSTRSRPSRASTRVLPGRNGAQHPRLLRRADPGPRSRGPVRPLRRRGVRRRGLRAPSAISTKYLTSWREDVAAATWSPAPPRCFPSPAAARRRRRQGCSLPPSVEVTCDRTGTAVLRRRRDGRRPGAEAEAGSPSTSARRRREPIGRS